MYIKIVNLILTILLILTIFTSCAQPPKKTDTMERIERSEDEWKNILTEEEYKVIRLKFTEPRFSGKYNKHYEDGEYKCKACGNLLFKSDVKYDSGSGWPAFSDCIEGSIKRVVDTSHGMQRIEILCAKCNGHLGHVFEDGPAPTHQRYCVNSISLEFKPHK